MYIPPESLFSKRVYKLEMITPKLSHCLTVRKKNHLFLSHMGILWCPKRGCKAPESSSWVINRYVSSHITSLILENKVLRMYFQRSQDPITSDQVIFQMLQYPVNWALWTFAKMLTKDQKVFSEHSVLKTELLCVYTFLRAQWFEDSPH